MPERIQRSRAAGWRMPPGAVYVGRPTRWGNPIPLNGSFTVWFAVSLGLRANAAGRREAALRGYRQWLTGELAPTEALREPPDLVLSDGSEISIEQHCRGLGATFATLYADEIAIPKPPPPADLAELRGRDLVCWCPLHLGCHADILLELANR